jgi:hypothetical protein
LARQAAARRVVPAAWSSARLSGRQHSEASLVHRDAAAPSLFRQVQGWPSAALSERASRQAQAAASHRPVEAAAAQVMASLSEMKVAAVVGELLVWPVASARRALRPVEGAASASGAKVQPPGAAEVLPEPSARQPGVAAVAEQVSAAEAQPPEAAGASGAGAVPPPEAAGVVLDVVAEPQQAVAVAVRLDAEVLRPGVAAGPGPSARQPAAAHPLAPPSWRPGVLLPWLAPRRVVRFAHAMRRSRAVSPSRQSWRAAVCEGLS